VKPIQCGGIVNETIGGIAFGQIILELHWGETNNTLVAHFPNVRLPEYDDDDFGTYAAVNTALVKAFDKVAFNTVQEWWRTSYGTAALLESGHLERAMKSLLPPVAEDIPS
jgi:hypothetical protein